MNNPPTRNRLLASLSPAELARFAPDLERVAFGAGTVLQEAFVPPRHVHFVESGLLSCLVGQEGRDQIEMAMIGSEGMAGLCIALSAGAAPFRIAAQRGGDALRLPAERFAEACRVSSELQRIVLRYAQVFTLQVAETGRANARQTVEARLARWLLMADDRINGDEIALTHEGLSLILGVRRPGITVSLHVLEGEHMIRARRGAIQILDRTKLEAAANGSYGLAEAEYRRLIAEAA